MLEYIEFSAYATALTVAASAACGYVWQTLINGGN
jgi:hypothetical protein